MVTSPKINLREHSGTGQLVKQVFYLWQGVFVLDSDIVQFTVIYKQTNRTILLIHKQYRGSPGWRTWSNQAFSQHIIQLLLQFYYFFRVHTIGSLSYGSSSRN